MIRAILSRLKRLFPYEGYDPEDRAPKLKPWTAEEQREFLAGIDRQNEEIMRKNR